ncbi:MAG: glycosyltransferase family 2 protein [Flavobacteriales bacterium]
MDNAVLFSIVIPTFNRAHCLGETIQSALAQTYPNVEIIVIDDGSTDNTESLVKSFSHSGVLYYKIENGERGAARNYGARVANGKYVNFLDSDDVLYPNHVSVAAHLVQANTTLPFFHLGYDVKDSAGNLIKRMNAFEKNIEREMIYNGNLLSCNGVFLDREVALANPFVENRELSGSEDYELWLRLLAKYTLVCSNEITSTVIDHDERSVVGMNKEKLIRRTEYLIKSLSSNDLFMKKFGQFMNVLKANNYSYISLHLALTGRNKVHVLKYLFCAMFSRPGFLLTRQFLAIAKHFFFRWK